MTFIEFLYKYGTKDPCNECRSNWWTKTPNLICTCDPIYLLTRLRVEPRGSLNKDTIYLISIEEDREVISTDYKLPPNYSERSDRYKCGNDIFEITRTIPVKDAKQFTILCDLNLNADDETTIYEPHIEFFESLFHSDLDSVRREIIFQQKTQKKIPVDIQSFESKIAEAKLEFLQRGLGMCHYEKSGYQMIAVLFLDKLFQILRKIKIDSLFTNGSKENPHMGQRKKKK